MSAQYTDGPMLQDGVLHRPGGCPRFVPEDDHVIRVKCGKWVYHPDLPCQCTENWPREARHGQ